MRREVAAQVGAVRGLLPAEPSGAERWARPGPALPARRASPAASGAARRARPARLVPQVFDRSSTGAEAAAALRWAGAAALGRSELSPAAPCPGTPRR